MTDILGYLLLGVILVLLTFTATVCVFRPWVLRRGLGNWKRGVPPKEGHEAMLQLRRDDPAEFQRVYGTHILAVRIVGAFMYLVVVSVLINTLFPDSR